MTYLFLGPPTSGKGTQAKLLADALKVPFYSVGALLREKAETNTQLADKINNGLFASDHEVQTILASIMPRHAGESIVLDGVPRTPEQVGMLIELSDPKELVVFLIDIDDEEIMSRAKKRIEDGHKRPDDAVSVVEERIRHYRGTINTIVNKLNEADIRVVKINGIGQIEAIHKTIIGSL